jgi:hypothetical protein
MYEYKFVKISLGGVLTYKPKVEYKGIITEQAKEGWRFVQIFAPATRGYGSASYFELIFERELPKDI